MKNLEEAKGDNLVVVLHQHRYTTQQAAGHPQLCAYEY
jgi:hypothetical protein